VAERFYKIDRITENGGPESAKATNAGWSIL
jgi:hypothetical protein